MSCSLRRSNGISPVMIRSELSDVPGMVPVTVLSALYCIEFLFQFGCK